MPVQIVDGNFHSFLLLKYSANRVPEQFFILRKYADSRIVGKDAGKQQVVMYECIGQRFTLVMKKEGGKRERSDKNEEGDNRKNFNAEFIEPIAKLKVCQELILQKLQS